jgi:ribA/ribD-fused uncharacterized protein
MEMWTAQYRYPGPYRLDITVKGGDPFGKLFAPTWNMVSTYMKSGKTDNDKQNYIKKYHELVLNIINTEDWSKLLNMQHVVLVCFCPPGEFCHRHLLVYYLQKYGANYNGEIVDLSRWLNKPQEIKEFKREYSWLSNFAPCKFVHLGVEYESTEAFYQAWKFSAVDTLKVVIRDKLVEVNAREYIAKQSANITKQLGKKAKLCWNWDTVKLEVMKVALEEKFKIPKFKNLLLSTGNAVLIEGNWWHDNYWGNCYCPKCKGTPGINMLGKMIMTIRDTYKGDLNELL